MRDVSTRGMDSAVLLLTTKPEKGNAATVAGTSKRPQHAELVSRALHVLTPTILHAHAPHGPAWWDAEAKWREGPRTQRQTMMESNKKKESRAGRSIGFPPKVTCRSLQRVPPTRTVHAGTSTSAEVALPKWTKHAHSWPEAGSHTHRASLSMPMLRCMASISRWKRSDFAPKKETRS